MQNRWWVIYVAIRDIHPGEELFVSYGDNYFESRNKKPA
jgi:SET domain-containing protein